MVRTSSAASIIHRARLSSLARRFITIEPTVVSPDQIFNHFLSTIERVTLPNKFVHPNEGSGHFRWSSKRRLARYS
eukprot:scaffold2629_cov152-Amphora_coffeaeformis.AAC.5